MKNAIIIVNYNRKNLLKKCLTSIFLMDNEDFFVFVVDNGSEDGSIEMVSEKFSQVEVIKMGYNSGFCRANNVGIQKAIDRGHENIILLNNDTEVDERFLSELVNGIDKNNTIEIIAPKVLHFSHRDKIDSAGIVITPDGLAKNRLLDSDKYGNASIGCEVFCPTGAAALFTTRVLNDIKQDGMFFDEDFEYYFEDLDLGWRARLRGWRCMYVSESIVYHHKNATSGAYSEFMAFYTNRNIFYNIIKNYPSGHCVRAFFLTFVRYFLLAFGIILRRGAGHKFQSNVRSKDLGVVVLKGWWSVMRNFAQLLKKRRYIQMRRSITRKDCNQWFNDFGLSFFDSLYK